jgi:hypothetical protein
MRVAPGWLWPRSAGRGPISRVLRRSRAVLVRPVPVAIEELARRILRMAVRVALRGDPHEKSDRRDRAEDAENAPEQVDAGTEVEHVTKAR